MSTVVNLVGMLETYYRTYRSSELDHLDCEVFFAELAEQIEEDIADLEDDLRADAPQEEGYRQQWSTLAAVKQQAQETVLAQYMPVS